MKNFLIGILLVAVIVFGYLTLKPKTDITISPTSVTPSGQTTTINNPAGKDYQPNSTSGNTTQNQTSNNSISTKLPSFVGAQEGWPPVIKHSSAEYSCSPSKNEASSTIQKTINGKTYCVTILEDGAAGTIYYTYNYVTADTNRTDKGGTDVAHFTLAYHDVDCTVTTSTPENLSCNSGEGSLNVDAIVDSLIPR